MKKKIIDFKQAKARIKAQKTSKVSVEERNKIIVECMPVLERIAKKISIRLPAHIERGDLISSGVIGLMDAIERYDNTRDNKFKTYAEFRIRGAMLDALRTQDWIPRSVREKTKKLFKATKKLFLELGRKPKDYEVAQALSMNMEEFHALINETRFANVVSINETSYEDKDALMNILKDKHTVINDLNVKDVNKQIKKIVDTLPIRERQVLSFYYYEGFNLRKIGQLLQVTESRVSQLHTQAIKKIKDRLEDQIQEEDRAVA